MRQYYIPQFNAPGIPCGARTVTCRTPFCVNFGIGLEMGDDGSPIICGPCGQEITDCVPIPDSNPAALVTDVTNVVPTTSSDATTPPASPDVVVPPLL